MIISSPILRSVTLSNTAHSALALSMMGIGLTKLRRSPTSFEGFLIFTAGFAMLVGKDDNSLPTNMVLTSNQTHPPIELRDHSGETVIQVDGGQSSAFLTHGHPDDDSTSHSRFLAIDDETDSVSETERHPSDPSNDSEVSLLQSAPDRLNLASSPLVPRRARVIIAQERWWGALLVQLNNAMTHPHQSPLDCERLMTVINSGRLLFNAFITASLRGKPLEAPRLEPGHPFYTANEFLVGSMTYNAGAVKKMQMAYQTLSKECLEEYLLRIARPNQTGSDIHKVESDLQTDRSIAETLLEIHLSITESRKPALAAWCAQGMLQFVSYFTHSMLKEILKSISNPSARDVAGPMKTVSNSCNLMLLWNCLLDDLADNVGLSPLCQVLANLTIDLASDASGKHSDKKMEGFPMSPLTSQQWDNGDQQGWPQWAITLSEATQGSYALFNYGLQVLELAHDAFQNTRSLIGSYSDSQLNQLLWDQLITVLTPLGECMVDAARFNESTTPFSQVWGYFTQSNSRDTYHGINFVPSFSSNMMVELIAWLTVAGHCHAIRSLVSESERTDCQSKINRIMSAKRGTLNVVIRNLQKVSRIGNNYGSYERELKAGDLTNLIFMTTLASEYFKSSSVKRLVDVWRTNPNASLETSNEWPEESNAGLEPLFPTECNTEFRIGNLTVSELDHVLSKKTLRDVLHAITHHMRFNPSTVAYLKNTELLKLPSEIGRVFALLDSIQQSVLKTDDTQQSAKLDTAMQNLKKLESQKKVWEEFFNLKSSDSVERDDIVKEILKTLFGEVTQVLEPSQYPCTFEALRVSYLELIIQYMLAQTKGQT